MMPRTHLEPPRIQQEGDEHPQRIEVGVATERTLRIEGFRNITTCIAQKAATKKSHNADQGINMNSRKG
jgi:hypothetical protein